MARRLTWTDVRGGLIACVVIALIALGILRYMRVGALKGETFSLYAVVSQARGVSTGSEVWLSGQKIGKITGIRFLPVTADTTRRIIIEMQVLAEHRHALRGDAIAQIRAGGSVIGAPVVYLEPGTLRAKLIAEGDTLRTRAQSDVEGATAQFSQATKEFPVIMENVRSLRAELGSSNGTVGAFMSGSASSRLKEANVQARRFMARLGGGGGSLAPIMRGGVTARAGRLMARVDSVRTLLASRQTSFGRFRRDSTLVQEIGDIREELAQVRASIDEPRGTVGRALHDSALTMSIAQAQREMSLLFADIKQHPARYLSVSF
jgi:phospholipid/cholesterol/gamma-HCH transport system substrate-binding protein